jgi:TonB family protein
VTNLRSTPEHAARDHQRPLAAVLSALRPLPWRANWLVQPVFHKLLIAGVVFAGHLLLLWSFEHSGSGQLHWQARWPVESVLVAQILEPLSRPDRGAAPQVHLESISVAIDPPRLVEINDPDGEPVPTMSGSASPPRLARFQPTDIGEFARRAGIETGRPLTVVLSVQVNADGDVVGIDVVRSCGLPAADKAAMDYVLLLRWIPGTVDGVPRSMRVILPMTLDAPADPLSALHDLCATHCAARPVEAARLRKPHTIGLMGRCNQCGLPSAARRGVGAAFVHPTILIRSVFARVVRTAFTEFRRLAWSTLEGQ